MTTTLGFDLFARDNVSKVLTTVGDEADATSRKFGGLSSATKAIGGLAVFEFGKKSVEAFSQSQAAQVQLQQAFAKFPKLADSSVGAFEALGEAQEKKTKFDHNSIDAAEAMLAQFNLSGAQIQQLTPLIEDYAAKTGKSLPDAAEAVGKAMLGQGRALKDIGIQFKDTKSAGGNFAELMTDLSGKVGGFADKQGKTAAGQTAILGHQFEDLEEKVGAKLVPALQKLTSVGIEVFDFFQKYGSIIGPIAVGIGAIATAVWLVNTAEKAWTAVQAALDVVMDANPIVLVVVAITALAAGFVLAYQHSATFRDIVQGAMHDVSAAIGWVVGAAKDVVDWIKNNWPLLLEIITGPFGLAVREISGHWDTIKTDVTDVKTFIVDRFNDVVTFFSGLPARIGTALSGMWDGIKDGFKAAINFVIRAWDAIPNFHFHVPHILGTNIGGDYTIGLPQIPELASGGIVPATPGGRLVRVGEGGQSEAVIPLNQKMLGAGAGGDIHIHFNGPIVGGSQSDARRLADFVHDALRAKVQANARSSGVTGFAGVGY